MRAYIQSVWVKVGLGLLLVGAGPLLFIIAAAAVGLWPDPNPNPIGPGLLFFFTFWPAVICIVVGVIRVRIGECQGCCRVGHAAAGCGARSGLSTTSPTGNQLRVEPLQRSGLARRARWYSSWRLARTASSRPL